MKRFGIFILSFILTVLIASNFVYAVDEIQLFTLQIEPGWDRAEIPPQLYDQLDRVVKVLEENPNTLARIEGHTDRTPGESKVYSQGLSERLARVVMEYMVRAGIEKSRLTAIGYGFTRPIAPNDIPENRRRNRRIEIYIEKEEKLEEIEPEQIVEPVKEEVPGIDSMLDRIDELGKRLEESESGLESYEKKAKAKRLWKYMGGLKERSRVLQEEKDIPKKESRMAGFYFGLGLSYVWDDFDKDYSSKDDGPYGFEPRYNDIGAHSVGDVYLADLFIIFETIKINANVGYEFSDRFSLEVCFDYMTGFFWEGDRTSYINEYYSQTDRASLRPEAMVNITTIMAAVKYSPFKISDFIHPYGVFGAGVMYGEIQKFWYGPVTIDLYLLGSELGGMFGLSGPIFLYRGRDSMRGPACKFGAGADVYINDHWSVGAELSYFIGMGDMDSIRYVKATGGITYHFK